VGAGRGRLRKIGVRSDDRDRLELLGLGDLKETAREFVDRMGPGEEHREI
jgi:hypothetical protein